MARKITLAFIAILCSTLFLIPSPSANASTTGTFYASSFSTTWRNLSGNSGNWSMGYSGSNDYPLSNHGSFGSSPETLTDLCISFNNLNLDSTAVSYNLSFTLSGSSHGVVFPSLGGGHQNNIVLSDNMAVSDSPNGAVDYYHNISGIAKNSGNRLCFTGAWAFGTSSSYFVFQPILTTYPLAKDVAQSVDNLNNTLQEQHKKEEEQRKEDEKKAEDTSNNSQSSSEDSQSKIDDDSQNLFQILTGFVGAITNSSPSSCNITGDFGFFNVGNINLCSGASKVQPITTVVGTIMLIGLIIPAVVSLLHRFMDLYNEVTN